MAGDDDLNEHLFERLSIEGNLARGLEPDPWGILSPPAAPAGGRSARISRTAVALLVIVALAAGAVAGAVAGRLSRPRVDSGQGLRAPDVVAVAQAGTLSDLVAQVAPAVVYISTRVPGLPDLLGPVPQGSVSGFLVDERGYIVTTRSAVDKVSDVGVVLPDGRQYAGKVVRKYPDNDIAIVKIPEEAAALPVVRLGRSADLRPGDQVVAVGNSLGFGGATTVSQGVVTTTHRKILPDLDGLIQTDARLGASLAGGPVLNLSGQVVGIAIVVPGGTDGSFAIGLDSIRPFVDQVVQRHTPMTAGVKVATLTPPLAYGVGVQYTRGVIVADVQRGGPAELAGLRPGDVVTQINGQPVETEERFIRITVTGATEPPLAVTVLHGQQSATVTLRLQEIPALS
jgi:S1-C subfamily serine protease